MTIKEAIDGARKIVLKIGSNTLVHSDGSINTEFLTKFADDCAGLIKKGKQLIIVSSGAQVTGLATISGWAHKRDVHYRQALCAIGQVELMDRWRLAFRDHNIHVAQLLLTKDDFEDDHRTLNIRNTMFTLVDENVIPIINENDTIAIDEIRIAAKLHPYRVSLVFARNKRRPFYNFEQLRPLYANARLKRLCKNAVVVYEVHIEKPRHYLCMFKVNRNMCF